MRRVILPLMAPGLFAGGTIVFIWAFTELGVPLIFDYNWVTPVQIFGLLKEMSGNPAPYALVSIMLGATILFYALSTGHIFRDCGSRESIVAVGRDRRRKAYAWKSFEDYAGLLEAHVSRVPIRF